MKIRLPNPHDGQRFVASNAKRFNWLSAGRRWRKTTLAMSISVENAVKGAHIIWGAPIYDQTRIAMEETRKAATGVAVFNETTMTAKFPSGGRITYRSLDNPDNVRGYTADGVVIDEVGDVDERAWYEVLRPMLIDTNGWGWGIGTPRGRNFFWREFTNAGDRTDTAAFQAPTLGVKVTENGLVRSPHPLENPLIPFAEIESLYRTMPERSFRQEILAEFLESSGGIFRNVRRAAINEALDKAVAGGEYVAGLDWARVTDYTVLTIFDVRSRREVFKDRFNQIGFNVQRDRIKAACKRFNVGAVIAETNSIGEPNIEQLERDGLPMIRFTTTNASKAMIIDALALAFEQDAITILNDDAAVAELEAFEQTRLPGGMMRYAAPDGMHDDCVISMALAHWGVIAANAPSVPTMLTYDEPISISPY